MSAATASMPRLGVASKGSGVLVTVLGLEHDRRNTLLAEAGQGRVRSWCSVIPSLAWLNSCRPSDVTTGPGPYRASIAIGENDVGLAFGHVHRASSMAVEVPG